MLEGEPEPLKKEIDDGFGVGSLRPPNGDLQWDAVDGHHEASLSDCEAPQPQLLLPPVYQHIPTPAGGRQPARHLGELGGYCRVAFIGPFTAGKMQPFYKPNSNQP